MILLSCAPYRQKLVFSHYLFCLDAGNILTTFFLIFWASFLFFWRFSPHHVVSAVMLKTPMAVTQLAWRLLLPFLHSLGICWLYVAYHEFFWFCLCFLFNSNKNFLEIIKRERKEGRNKQTQDLCQYWLVSLFYNNGA